MVRNCQQINPQKYYLLDSAQISDVQAEFDVETQRRKSKRQSWCCALCGAYVTDESQHVHINGSLEHRKINPQGYTFEFRSFKHADGCARVGAMTSEHSWFAGYFWQFAHCGKCKIQLGWYFDGPEPFFGLINRQIVQCPEEKSG